MLHPNFFRPLVSALVLTCCLSGARSQEPASAPARAIEYFISPAQLFPSEGAWEAPYAPMPVFDRPFGKRIGQVSASFEPCIESSPSDCTYASGWTLERDGGARYPLRTEEVGYAEPALVTYRAPLKDGTMRWSEVQYDGGAFWMHTPATDVTEYESLATWIEDIETWCDRPGTCRPATAAMRADIARVKSGEITLQSCGGVLYEIEGIVHHRGKRYYKVKLYEIEPGSPPLHLPRAGYIPTRRANGAHASTYYARGC